MNTISLLLVLGIAQSGLAAVYKLDKSHMQVGFSIRHLMVSNVKGHFDKVDGSIDFDGKTETLKSINAEIEAASINTNEADRDKHLRNDDFFAVDKHPKITFVSDKAVVVKKGKTAKVPGTLTIKNVAKPVTLDVTNNGEIEFMGTKKIGFSASTKINRKDFGMAWNKALDKGGVAVGDEVTITIEGEANMAAEKAEAKK